MMHTEVVNLKSSPLFRNIHKGCKDVLDLISSVSSTHKNKTDKETNNSVKKSLQLHFEWLCGV